MASGDYEQALNFYNHTLSTKPDQFVLDGWRMELKRAECFSNLGRTIDTETVCRRLIGEIARWMKSSDLNERTLRIYGKIQLDALCGLADNSLLSGKLNKTERLAHWILNQADHFADQRIYAKALSLLGEVAHLHGNLIKGLEIYEECLEISQENNLVELIRSCYKNIGFIWFYRSEYDRAKDYFDKAYALCHEVQDQVASGSRLTEIKYWFGLSDEGQLSTGVENVSGIISYC